MSLELMFTKTELATAKQIIPNICPVCNQTCGILFNACHMEICGSCLDDFYDSYGKKIGYFPCLNCNNIIMDISIKKYETFKK